MDMTKRQWKEWRDIPTDEQMKLLSDVVTYIKSDDPVTDYKIHENKQYTVITSDVESVFELLDGSWVYGSILFTISVDLSGNIVYKQESTSIYPEATILEHCSDYRRNLKKKSEGLVDIEDFRNMLIEKIVESDKKREK